MWLFFLKFERIICIKSSSGKVNVTILAFL